MQRERRRALPASLARLGLAFGLIVLAGCSTGDEEKPTLTVSAATSLSGAFTEIGEAFGDADVELNFGSSTSLADAIANGAPADVFAAADQTSMTKLQEADLVVGNPFTFAHNTLVIVVKPGNPEQIRTAADLARAGVVSLCAVEAPCGAYAAQALVSAKVVLDEARVTRGQNVAATLDAVAEGDAVAGIVYVTDAQARAAQVDTVTIPDTQNVIAAYPIAVIGAEPNPAAAAFVKFVAGPTGQRILKKYGFLP